MPFWSPHHRIGILTTAPHPHQKEGHRIPRNRTACLWATNRTACP